ncbi:MAG: hypothetical protein ACTSYQ_02295, partial [Candidatus Odinarchaeia archaeon]
VEGASLISIGLATTIEFFTVASWISSFGFALLASPFWGIISRTTSKNQLASIIFFTTIMLTLGRIVAIALLSPLLISGAINLIFITIGILAFIGSLIVVVFPSQLFSNKIQGE